MNCGISPEWNPAAKGFTSHLLNFLPIYTTGFAKKVIASTHNLERSNVASCGVSPDKVIVLENLVTQKAYNPFINQNRKHSDAPKKIIWSGGNSHKGDLDPFLDIFEYYKDREDILSIMFGYLPDEWMQFKPDKMMYIPMCNRKYYEGVLVSLAAHVAIIPLVDIQFNSCKSAIKYYEMTLAGIPSIVQDVSPYKDVIENNYNGFIARNKNDWIYYCDVLLNDERLWEIMIERAMRNVLENYSWDVPNKRNRAWLEFFKSVPDL